MPNRLEHQIQFVLELDKLKSIIRRTYLVNNERRENSAEHSWHLGLMAMLLAEHANESVDVVRVMKMVLVHDIVEIDAGDTFAYDTTSQADQAEREQQAADRLFNLLPADQAMELRSLWDEFEARKTPDAKFAKALDHLLPLLQNYASDGKGWREHNISLKQVIDYNGKMEDGSETLWQYAKSLLDDALEKEILSQ